MFTRGTYTKYIWRCPEMEVPLIIIYVLFGFSITDHIGVPHLWNPLISWGPSIMDETW